MNRDGTNSRGLLTELIGDGRSLITFTGLILGLCGLFALFLSATKHFLPHDVEFLGMTPPDLCLINECRIVHFMIHDRVSFGGALIAIATLYLWLAAFPLQMGEAWAWWLLVMSGGIGFGSFLLYLGYGYLDTWHGMATLALLPCFLAGLWKTYPISGSNEGIRSLFRPSERPSWKSGFGVGRCLLLGTAAAMAAGGITIMMVGITTVFVPQDLEYIGLDATAMRAINANLLPLIAHDRAGFGGGVCCCGVTMFFCVWCGTPSRSLWQALFLTGLAGFGTAIGVHPAIGYTSFTHLAPAYLGAAMFTVGIVLTYRRMCRCTVTD